MNNIVALKTLVAMQLKDRMRSSLKPSVKAKILKATLSVLGVAVVTVAMYFLMKLAIDLSLFDLLKRLPVSVIVVIFTILLILSTIVNTVMLSKSLYFSSDNSILLTMPVNANVIFFSKIIVFYVYELFKSLFSVFPLFIAYGVISNFGGIYYVWMPICIIFISMIPVLLGALLSIPTMFITTLLKKNKIVSTILFAIIVGAFIYLVIYLISLIPNNLNIIERWGVWFWKIQDFLDGFVVKFYPFTKVTEMVVGRYIGFVYKLFGLQTLWVFLSVITVVFALVLVNYLASRPLFFKMASKPFEHNKRNSVKQKNNVALSKKSSVIVKDFLLFLRDKNNLYNVLSVAICLPIITLLFNKIISAMDTRLLGNFMGLGFNLLLVLVIVLSSNVIMASVYSREANASYVEKTRPVESVVPMLSKLIFNFVIISVSIIISGIIIVKVRNLGFISALCLIVALVSIYTAHLLWSAELDFMNPQNKQYQTSAIVQNNPNERTSTILSYAISFIFFLIFFILLRENVSHAFIKLVIVSIAFLITRVILFIKKVKYYHNRRTE